jgi:hypothetical protein
MSDLTPAEVAKSDQELAMLDRILTSLVKQWDGFRADKTRAIRIGCCMHDVSRQTDQSGVLALLAVAVDRLARKAADE